MLNINQFAPSFSLYSDTKELIHLNDYKGNAVVLLFFPLAFSDVCTTELCHIRDNMAAYTNLNAQILGISVDSVFVLEQFKAQHNIPFPLLSDFNKTTMQAYDCMHDSFAFEMKGVAKRSVFLLDYEGKLQYQEILEDPGSLPNFSAVEDALGKI